MHYSTAIYCLINSVLTVLSCGLTRPSQMVRLFYSKVERQVMVYSFRHKFYILISNKSAPFCIIFTLFANCDSFNPNSWSCTAGGGGGME